LDSTNYRRFGSLDEALFKRPGLHQFAENFLLQHNDLEVSITDISSNLHHRVRYHLLAGTFSLFSLPLTTVSKLCEHSASFTSVYITIFANSCFE
jgi:hypothetical protein